MRKQLLKQATATLIGLGALVGARSALAASSVHGVVFIHGTGDSPVAGQKTASTTALTCTANLNGSVGTSCYAPAAYGGSNYWESGEVASIAQGRPFAVVGFYGGSCAPWPQSSNTFGTATGDFYNTADSTTQCPLATGVGNGDIIAAQIQQFISANNLTELTIVTHSGGSNQARYLLDNYTRNSYYTNIKNITQRVITIAGTTDGTYLANEVFSGSITSFIGGLVGYGGEGVNLLRTNYMNTFNTSSSFLGPKVNPVSGVNFYSTGGTSKSTCYGVTVWGVCIGVTAQTLGTSATGGISCDSLVDDVALLALHDLWLDTNDSSTYRNSCSDGFISCQGSQALGNTFAYSGGQDHNQSRRQCNNLDVNVRGYVTSSAKGFDYGGASSQINPHQLDACGFGTYAAVTSGSRTIAWTEGCTTAQLGNGNCDWDCVALYGNDAVVTQWDSTGTKPLAWGTSDCTANDETYNGTTYLTNSTDPFAENGTYTTSSGTYQTAFNGYTCTGTSAQCGGYSPSSYQWFYDPNYTSNGNDLYVGYCPQSWIGDGTCDECVLALYGQDGMDCAPGHIVQCGGIVTAAQPYKGSSYYYYNNPIYNEGTPSNGGESWLEWASMPAVSGDGVCENTECTASVTFPGTAQCSVNSDCASGTCVNGGCTTQGADCSATWAVQPRTCATNADCTGNSCQTATGTCLITGTACTSDANCPTSGTDMSGNAWSATSTCGSGICSCTTSNDCSGGAACNSGTCASSVTQSLCR